MNNNYLIPANSKKSLLILSAFTPFDLVLFGGGLAVTFLLLLIFSPSNVWFAVIDILPALITGFLVIPMPNYHNTRILLREVYRYFTNRQKFIWKGWCVKDEFGEEKQVHK